MIWLLACVAAAQVLFPENARIALRTELWDYRDAIGEYRRGGVAADGVIDRILIWDRKRLDRVLGGIGTLEDEVRPWEPAFLRAAAMMHTDVALRLLQRAETDQALLHADAAGALLTKTTSHGDAFAGRWCLAIARLLRSSNLFPPAERFLESCRQRWPQNPVVLSESGALEEVLAVDATVPVVIELVDTGGRLPTIPAGGTAAPPVARRDVEALVRRRAGHLDRAARWLQQSLDVDPSDAGARLRLGRVQTLRNQHDAALTLLQGAAASEDQGVAYLARLFTGALHERRGRFEAAADAYRAAIERAPSSHAAYVALSAVLRRLGQGDAARATLSRAVDGTLRNRRDPWWSYLHEAAGVSLARFSDLRREARS